MSIVMLIYVLRAGNWFWGWMMMNWWRAEAINRIRFFRGIDFGGSLTCKIYPVAVYFGTSLSQSAGQQRYHSELLTFYHKTFGWWRRIMPAALACERVDHMCRWSVCFQLLLILLVKQRYFLVLCLFPLHTLTTISNTDGVCVSSYSWFY